MINKINITIDNLDLLKNFITKNKNGSKFFRYYDKREFTIIQNHIKTKLYYDDDNNYIGYGHLDYEDKLWLGIIIADEYTGKKYANFIMHDLLSDITEDVYLTVDIENEKAINLYKKYEFTIIEKTNSYYLMFRNKK